MNRNAAVMVLKCNFHITNTTITTSQLLQQTQQCSFCWCKIQSTRRIYNWQI